MPLIINSYLVGSIEYIIGGIQYVVVLNFSVLLKTSIMYCWKKNALSPKERRGYILLSLVLNITKNILTKDVSSSKYPVEQRTPYSSFQIYLQSQRSVSTNKHQQTTTTTTTTTVEKEKR